MFYFLTIILQISHAFSTLFNHKVFSFIISLLITLLTWLRFLTTQTELRTSRPLTLKCIAVIIRTTNLTLKQLYIFSAECSYIILRINRN